MWVRGGRECLNMKGLVSFDRKEKKDSYYWYKANWSKHPVLYITQRRNNDRERKLTTVTVYSNKGIPTVTLNGKQLPAPRQGYTPVHWIFDNVELAEGENHIHAECGTLSDEIVWQYTGEKDRSPEKYENREMHVGF